MIFNSFAINYSLVMFVGLITCLKVGHFLGRRHRPREKETGGGSAIDASLFALLGLFLAFTFSSALDSYNKHQEQLTDEANNIATVYTNLDLLPSKLQDVLRPLMLQYAETRLEATEAAMDSSEERFALIKGKELQDQIWEHIVGFIKESNNSAINNHIIDSFNDMAGSPGEQISEQRNNTPKIIYVLIILLALMSATIAGYGMADYTKLPVLRIALFAISATLTIYVVIDLEYPRSGFFTSVSSNYMLMDVISDMR